MHTEADGSSTSDPLYFRVESFRDRRSEFTAFLLRISLSAQTFLDNLFRNSFVGMWLPTKKCDIGTGVGACGGCHKGTGGSLVRASSRAEILKRQLLWDRIAAFQIPAKRAGKFRGRPQKGAMVTGENSAASLSVTLIARIRSGERAAEEELVTLYRRPVFAIAAARTGDREVARDLTQEVLIVVLKAARSGQIRESEKLAAFIQGTARNLINNYFKSRIRRAESTLETAEDLGNDPVGELEAAERRRLVQAELRSYSVLDQQILLFSLVDGHSLAEVAERLKMSHEAVRARKSRLVRKITKKFGGLSHK